VKPRGSAFWFYRTLKIKGLVAVLENVSASVYSIRVCEGGLAAL
jgi:hypothetical protein